MMFLTELRPMNMNMNWAAPITPNTQAAKAALKAMAPQAAQAQTAGFQPRVSLCETPEAYLIQMELPGVGPETLELVLVNDELTVRGEKRPEALDGQWHVNERGFGPFERAFRFPTHVTQEGVQAETVHGILAIRVAKAKEAVPRKIQVISR